MTSIVQYFKLGTFTVTDVPFMTKSSSTGAPRLESGEATHTRVGFLKHGIVTSKSVMVSGSVCVLLASCQSR